MKKIRATDLRIHTREILEQVHWQGEVCQVTTFGHPVAVIVSVEEYARLIAAAAVPVVDPAVSRGTGIPVVLPEPSVAVGQ